MLLISQVSDPLPFADARPIAKFVTEKFLSGEYNKCPGSLHQLRQHLASRPMGHPACLRSNPTPLLRKRAYEGVGKDSGRVKPTKKTALGQATTSSSLVPEAVLDTLLPLYHQLPGLPDAG